jgi:hypothetical protein
MDSHALHIHPIEVHSHSTLRAALAYLHNTDHILGTHAWDSGPATHKHGMRRQPVVRLKLPRLLKDLTSVRKSYLRGNFDNCSGLRTDVRSCALSATLVRLLFFTASGVRMCRPILFPWRRCSGSIEPQTVLCSRPFRAARMPYVNDERTRTGQLACNVILG